MVERYADTGLTRRALGRGVVAGISLALLPLPSPTRAESPAPARSDGAWNRVAGAAEHRVDGLGKVTGAKLYGADYRAADLPGWPQRTGHAMLLRADRVDQLFESVFLDSLETELRPDRIVLAADLDAVGIRVPTFYAGDLLCPAGTPPRYLGQPLALLLWRDFARFAAARRTLRFDPRAVRYGARAPIPNRLPYGGNRFVRVAGATPDAPDLFSPLLAGWVTPRRFRHSTDPVWAGPDAGGDAAARASRYGDALRADLDEPDSSLLVVDQHFETQSVDQMFMEPENGLAWYNPATQRLAMLVGTQSAQDTLESTAVLLGDAGPARVTAVTAYCPFMGGGFGGRDHSIFPLYVALAGYFGEGAPMRLANDRFAQFQSGLKRHAFRIDSRLAVDRATGRMTGFVADMRLDGGGLANFSMSVGDVGATAAIGIYDVPRVDVTVVAEASHAVPAGSMRGFGTLQAMTSLEVAVDRAAEALGIDPIAFRRRNALPSGGKTMTGNVAAGAMRTGEILDKLQAHRLWRERMTGVATPGGRVRGIGVACVNKDYGAGADAGLATVELSPEGEITVVSSATEMGTGISTAVARRPQRWLGVAADHIEIADPDRWAPLRLVATGDPYSMTQAEQDRLAADPRWVPALNSPTSASIAAAVFSEVVSEAARAVYLHGLWPAALSIWREGPAGGQAAGMALRPEMGRFADGRLTAAGMEPLPLPRLTARAHALGAVTGAMVHGFNRWAWASARFDVDGDTFFGTVDAMAVRRGSADAYSLLDRAEVAFPDTLLERVGATYLSCAGSLVAVSVDRATGEVRVDEAYTVIEAGQAIVPELVSGQIQGGFAMAVGQALMEHLPLYDDGPGNGTWNLNRYRVPRIADLPVWSLEAEILPPVSDDTPPKGIAEVVMCPVIPAILNGIHAAIGHRFLSLPVTPEAVRRVLG